MKRVATFFEIIFSVSLLLAGFYLLNEGISTKSTSAPAMLIAGAVCVSMSALTLGFAVRSLIWHRRMLRHVHGHRLEHAASGHNRG